MASTTRREASRWPGGEFYASQRELAGVAEAFGEYEPEFAQRVPDAFVARDLADSVATQRRADPVGQLDFDALCESVRGHVMGYPVRASDWTMTRNARRDPAHPKWAFVAHAGACSWCVMISSNGFRFASEAKAAAQRHAHFTCPVVVDFDVDNPSLVGYDPDGMYERLHRCGESIDSSDWGDILKEAATRDREWLRTGRRPGYTIIEGAVPSQKEKGLATVLSGDGWKSAFRPTKSKQGKRTSDVFFLSDRDGQDEVPVEFKQPTGNGKQTVAHQFEEAAG